MSNSHLEENFLVLLVRLDFDLLVELNDGGKGSSSLFLLLSSSGDNGVLFGGRHAFLGENVVWVGVVGEEEREERSLATERGDGEGWEAQAQICRTPKRVCGDLSR